MVFTPFVLLCIGAFVLQGVISPVLVSVGFGGVEASSDLVVISFSSCMARDYALQTSRHMLSELFDFTDTAIGNWRGGPQNNQGI